MSETILTQGWASPTGKCDICNKRKATHWFGDTSVALCDNEECAKSNMINWKRTQEEIDDEESRD